MGEMKHYYAGSSSSMGFYSLYEEATKALDQIYVLTGGPGTGKSTFMRKIGLVCMEQGLDLEYYHCSLDQQAIDGIVIPAYKVGFFDGDAPHPIEPKYPGIREHIIDLNRYLDNDAVKQNASHMIHITNEMRRNLNLAYQTFAQAKDIHLQKEQIYLQGFDFKKADDVKDKLTTRIFSRPFTGDKEPVTRSLFFGANTASGPVHFIDHLTSNVQKRFIIKGRPGTGKSTLMKHIGKKAERASLSVEYFPCSFDPNSLDMVIIPSLSVCLVDGTAPHTVDACRSQDEIIDMYAMCTDPQTESGQSFEAIKQLDITYRSIMTKGTNYLSEAKRLHDKLTEYYKNAMDFSGTQQLRQELVAEVLTVRN